MAMPSKGYDKTWHKNPYAVGVAEDRSSAEGTSLEEALKTNTKETFLGILCYMALKYALMVFAILLAEELPGLVPKLLMALTCSGILFAFDDLVQAVLAQVGLNHVE